MLAKRIAPAVALALAILVLAPLRNHYQFRYQAAALLALAAVTGTWLLIAFLQKRPLAGSAIDRPLYALVIAFTISAAVSLDPRRSLGQVQSLLAHVLLFWLVFDLVSGRRTPASSLKAQASPPANPEAGTGQPEPWAAGLLAVSGVLLFLAIAEVESWYLMWRGIGGAAHPWPPFGYRLVSWLGHASGFSALVAACTPLAIAVLLRTRRPAIRICLGLWVLGAVLGLVFASSRAGWLAFGAGLAALAALSALARLLGPAPRPLPSDVSKSRVEAGAEAERTGSAKRLAGRWILGAAGVVLITAVGWFAFQRFQDPTHAPILLSRSELWPPAWAAFTSSPFLGTGPATFYRHFLAANPLSQHTFLTQAHSVLFSLIAEEGILGTAAAAAVIAAGLLGAIRSLRAARPDDGPLQAAALAGLAALGVHALTDNASTTPPVSFVLIVLAALLLARPATPRRTLPASIPTLVLLTLLGYGALTLPGQLSFERGLSFADQDRPAAAAALAAAAQAEPAFGWYSLQAGFAYAQAAQGDPSYLDEARDRLETGIRLEPAYSLHGLNLAWVYWELGDREAALTSIERAAAIDPTSPLILLNQGWMLEVNGDPRSAASAYHAALDSDAMQAALGYAMPHGSLPNLADSLFWDSNDFRRQVRQRWSLTIEPTAYAAAIEEGFRKLGVSNAPAAHQHWQEARRLDPFRPEAYRGLGLTAADEGKTDEARYFLQAAGNARGSAYQRMLAWLDLMELEASAGQPSRAIEAGRRGFELLESYNSWGIGSHHANPFAWGVFYRESLPDDVLPWVIRPDISPALADQLLHYSLLLGHAGDSSAACDVVRRILAAAPNSQPAQEAFAHFSCPP